MVCIPFACVHFWCANVACRGDRNTAGCSFCPFTRTQGLLRATTKKSACSMRLEGTPPQHNMLPAHHRGALSLS